MKCGSLLRLLLTAYMCTKGEHNLQNTEITMKDNKSKQIAILTLPLDVPGVSNWVAIKDALPNNNEEVLTITADGWYRIITYGNTGRRFPSQVTHWMRLPKPPCC